MNLYGKVNVNNISKNIDLSYFESHVTQASYEKNEDLAKEIFKFWVEST